MNLYQVALPERTNDGMKSYYAALSEWSRRALLKAGGYTYLGMRRGVWRDPSSGDVYDESMHGYQVACSPEIMEVLTRDAFELFPDQAAIFVAHVGAAEIVPRMPQPEPGSLEYEDLKAAE